MKHIHVTPPAVEPIGMWVASLELIPAAIEAAERRIAERYRTNHPYTVEQLTLRARKKRA